MVELALTLPLLVFSVLGGADMARAFALQIAIENSSRAGAESFAIDYPDGDNQRNHRVTVDATAPFIPLPSQYLLGGVFQLTLRGGSQLFIQR